MAIDSGGNLYVADLGNNRVRKINISSNLDITTVAGIGIDGFYGDTKAAASAELFWPFSVAVDASANVYIADTNNNRIRAVGKPKAVAPVVSWPTPATINYGTPLSATQLDATAAIPGTFSYTPALGQVLSLGSDTLSVTFTPTDSVDYTTATAQTTISVIQALPKITWATPAAIPAGTALSATQLNATANTAGTFTYSPAAHGNADTLGQLRSQQHIGICSSDRLGATYRDSQPNGGHYPYVCRNRNSRLCRSRLSG
jgi:hypothetical protein